MVLSPTSRTWQTSNNVSSTGASALENAALRNVTTNRASRIDGVTLLFASMPHILPRMKSRLSTNWNSIHKPLLSGLLLQKVRCCHVPRLVSTCRHGWCCVTCHSACTWLASDAAKHAVPCRFCFVAATSVLIDCVDRANGSAGWALEDLSFQKGYSNRDPHSTAWLLHQR
jgi:hypothetical protein